ncbi:patatin-like phospholipase family protein [Chloroflexota bacterium]
MGLKRGKSPAKTGLALGSGVARGLAHIGVLKVLEEEGIDIDMVAGTSIGAYIGALYARGDDADSIRKLAEEIGSRRVSFLTDFALPKTGLIRGRRIENTLKSVFGDTEISDLKKPFACVATDIDSGEEVVIDRGRVREALRASISVPVALAVAKWQGRYLVDGNLVNPVPVSLLRAMGADFVIAVNVIPYRGAAADETTEPNIFHVIMHTLNIVGYHAVKSSLAGADVVIEPEVDRIGLTDFHRVDELVSTGERAARAAVPEIKRHLPALRRGELS